MIIEPIIKAKLKKFIEKYELDMDEDSAFERFANWVLLQRHQPDAFSTDTDLLDSVSAGGGNDLGIDGLCIKINGFLIKSITEAKDLVEKYSKIKIEFIFIQSKNKNALKQQEHNIFYSGVKEFLSEKQYQPMNEKITSWLEIKNYLLSEDCCAKWADNPKIYIYYVYLGDIAKTDHTNANEEKVIEEIKRLNIYNKDIVHEVITGDKLKELYNENENSFDAHLSIIETCSFLGENETINGIESNSTIATCRTSELLKLLKSEDGMLRRGIFNDNVRDYQGETPINTEILHTIETNPQNFVLFNNGITIVCNKLITNGKNLVVSNPQIVNGCQTCNMIYNASLKSQNIDNLSQAKVVLKIISTSNETIVNNVVKGTNKQNIVQDEAFETIREFHKNLEEFFIAANSEYKAAFPVYYERRAHQYENTNINEYAKIKFSYLIRAFISVFLSEPHKSVNHPAKLQKQYNNIIFLDTQSLLPYYTAVQLYSFVDASVRKGAISSKLRAFKAHLSYLFPLIAVGAIPNINDTKKIDSYCSKLLHLLNDCSRANEILSKGADLLISAQEAWINANESKYGMKDNAKFTELLQKHVSRIENIKIDPQSKIKYKGIITRLTIMKSKLSGFILQNDGKEIFFNEKEIINMPKGNLLNKEVLFDIITTGDTQKAINVEFLS